MGVLDELKKEAATVKAKEEKIRTSDEAQRDALLKKIRPKMQSLYGFFKELAENLAVVAPDVRYDYEIPGFGPAKRITARRLSGIYARQQGPRPVHVPFQLCFRRCREVPG